MNLLASRASRGSRAARLPFFVTAVSLLVAACSPEPGVVVESALSADIVPAVRGVPDDGAHPAVVALDVGDGSLCSGALVAPDVVLTARHCVSFTASGISCPSDGGEAQIEGARDPTSIKVLLGDAADAMTLAALGWQIVAPDTPELCGADVALLVLDRQVEGVEPFGVSAAGIAQGSHVVALGFGEAPGGGGSIVKVLRAHVKVAESTPAELVVDEATCVGQSGGPALDEATGEIVGVLSRQGAGGCDGPAAYDVYTRADMYLALVKEAASKAPDAKDAGVEKKPSTDLGAACQGGADCAAGVCVTNGAARYCSRTCASGDKCPSGFACHEDEKGDDVCVED